MRQRGHRASAVALQGGRMTGKVKASKVRVHAPPEGAIGLDGHFHVYVVDVVHKTFLPGKSFDTIERAASFQRRTQQRDYTAVEAMERGFGTQLGMRVLVLCGPGNNGGDGFVAARHLEARGADVQAVLLGDPSRVAGDARANLERLAACDLVPIAVATEADLERVLASRDQWDFALDALLGTGARGLPEGIVAAGVQALRSLDDAGTRVVAVDLPTGVNADTGTVARRAVRADLTVTFGAPKRGQFLFPGRAFVGSLEVVDIGLAMDVAGAFPVSLATATDMAALLPARDPRAHKGSVGRVLVIGGSAGLTGAVALAARAASRAGAGYVHAAVPPSPRDGAEVTLTLETTFPMPETSERTLSMA